MHGWSRDTADFSSTIWSDSRFRSDLITLQRNPAHQVPGHVLFGQKDRTKSSDAEEPNQPELAVELASHAAGVDLGALFAGTRTSVYVRVVRRD